MRANDVPVRDILYVECSRHHISDCQIDGGWLEKYGSLKAIGITGIFTERDLDIMLYVADRHAVHIVPEDECSFSHGQAKCAGTRIFDRLFSDCVKVFVRHGQLLINKTPSSVHVFPQRLEGDVAYVLS